MVVTGASGFVGRYLCQVLTEKGQDVFRVSRTSGLSLGDLGGNTDWSPALERGTTVVHLAARAHVLDKSSAKDIAAFREVNVAATERLATEAGKLGVRRLIFLSSIRVHGTNTNGRPPFSVEDIPVPSEAYAISKWQGEQALWQIALETGLEVCIIRPTLVYGRGAGGNFARLVKLVRRGYPLPLGAVENSRSLISLDNLVDLIDVCITHPAAAGETLLASDGVSWSTPELIRGIAKAMGRPARLWDVPLDVLRIAGGILGKTAEIDRLIGSLEVDITHTRHVLGWRPPMEMEEGLRRAVR